MKTRITWMEKKKKNKGFKLIKWENIRMINCIWPQRIPKSYLPTSKTCTLTESSFMEPKREWLENIKILMLSSSKNPQSQESQRSQQCSTGRRKRVKEKQNKYKSTYNPPRTRKNWMKSEGSRPCGRLKGAPSSLKLTSTRTSPKTLRMSPPAKDLKTSTVECQGGPTRTNKEGQKMTWKWRTIRRNTRSLPK